MFRMRMCCIIGRIGHLCLYPRLIRPFRAAKEMHLATVHALINVFSKIESSIADLSTSISMCFSSKNSFIISASKFLSNHFSPCRQHSQGLPKPWVAHPSFGVRYGGFYGGAGTFC